MLRIGDFMNKKLTNSKALEIVLGFDIVQQNEELFDKLTQMKAQIDKKNKGAVDSEGKKILTVEQKKNLVIKDEIMLVLSQYDEPKCIKEIQAENPTLSVEKYSNQKISALIRQLIAEGKVIRQEEKRVAKFSLA